MPCWPLTAENCQMIVANLKHRQSRRRRAMPVFDAEYDLIVAGVGTAGAIAALAAAESGVKVGCMERLAMAGGTATAGGVPVYYYGIPGGRYADVDAGAEVCFGTDFVKSYKFSFHPDAKGMAIEAKLRQAGAEIHFETTVIGVFLDDDGVTVRGVRAVTPAGVCCFGCRMLIDATGNGEVCAIAGAAYCEGRKSDGKPQPFSSIRLFRRDAGLALANFDAGYVRSDDGEALSRAIVASNALHVKPVGEPQELLYSLSLVPGLREGRLIVCDERADFAKFLAGKSTGQPLGYAYAHFDSHSQDWALTDELTRDWMVVASLWGKPAVVPLTLGIMVVKDFRNLLVAGRALSLDHLMASLVRMQPCMQKQGEIAGRAAALALRSGKDLRTINLDRLKSELRRSGCLGEQPPPECGFPDAPDQLRELLGSAKPGEAIWQTSRRLDRYRPLLVELLANGSPQARANSALALGLARDPAALPVLREMVRRRDAFIPQTSCAKNQPRLLAAVDLLGRFGQPEDAEQLLEIFSRSDTETQLFTHLFRSLLELGDALPAWRIRISRALKCGLNQNSHACRLPLQNTSRSGLSVVEDLKGSLLQLAAPHFKKWRYTQTHSHPIGKEKVER